MHVYTRLSSALSSTLTHYGSPDITSHTLVFVGIPDLLGDTIAILLPLLGNAASTLLALGHGLKHANLHFNNTTSTPTTSHHAEI